MYPNDQTQMGIGQGAVHEEGIGCDAESKVPSGCLPVGALANIRRWTDLALPTCGRRRLNGDRIAMQLPQVTADQISYVTDHRVCSKLVTPYNANVGFQAPATGPGETPSGQLHVVKVGTVYVVSDPSLRAGDFRLLATLDKHYKLLWKGLG